MHGIERTPDRGAPHHRLAKPLRFQLLPFGYLSHRGTLAIGRPARFSEYGTLLATIETLVDRSDAGYYCDELEHLLGVSAKEALLGLFRKEKVSRETFGGRYLYCSSDSG